MLPKMEVKKEKLQWPNKTFCGNNKIWAEKQLLQRYQKMRPEFEIYKLYEEKWPI